MILCREGFARRINSTVFPGTQGGPLMHVIAAKAVAFQEALTDEFREYQRQIVKNSQAFAREMADLGYRIVAGGTDNHLFMVDLRSKGITGKDAAAVLDQVRITVNKNLIPFDPQPPVTTSGIRIGTPVVTSRGMKEKQMKRIADLTDEAMTRKDDENELAKVRKGVEELTREFPIYKGLKG
jgi:glycine hydroxymethyltransferase